MFVQFSTEIDIAVRSSRTSMLIFVEVFRGNGSSVIVNVSFTIIWLLWFPPTTNVQLRPAEFRILSHVTLTVLLSESAEVTEQLFDVASYTDNSDGFIKEQL
jgi:hypothetical protein